MTVFGGEHTSTTAKVYQMFGMMSTGMAGEDFRGQEDAIILLKVNLEGNTTKSLERRR